MDRTASQQRVAFRALVQQAALAAASARVASASPNSVLTAEVLAAFGEAFFPYQQGRRLAFGGMVKKLKELSQVFTKVPKLWETFKRLIGVHSLADLPGALKKLAKQGYDALRKLLHKAFDSWPLKLYTLEHGKMLGVNDLIDKLLSQMPAFKSWMASNVKPKIDQFDYWLREHFPRVSTVVMVGIYIWVWFNVVEFEWDMKGLTDAITGHLSLSSLLASLPGSGIGFLMNALNLGTFTLLPATLAARLLYLMSKRYLVWTGSGFELDMEKLKADFA